MDTGERIPVEGEWVSRGNKIAFIAEIGSISKTKDGSFQAELFDGEVIAVDADQDIAMLLLENAIRHGRVVDKNVETEAVEGVK